MREDFIESARKTVTIMKEAKATPQEAARALEVLCGKNNQEYVDNGPALVEEIYDGKLSQAVGGAGLAFTPNPPRLTPAEPAKLEIAKHDDNIPPATEEVAHDEITEEA